MPSENYATTKDVQEIVDKAVADLSDIITSLAQNMHDELREVRQDISTMDKSVTTQFTALQADVNRI